MTLLMFVWVAQFVMSPQITRIHVHSRSWRLEEASSQLFVALVIPEMEWGSLISIICCYNLENEEASFKKLEHFIWEHIICYFGTKKELFLIMAHHLWTDMSENFLARRVQSREVHALLSSKERPDIRYEQTLKMPSQILSWRCGLTLLLNGQIL